MKLSEYIKRLQKIQRQQAKQVGHDQDPEVCMSRYSDMTTDLGNGDEADVFPRVIRAMPVGGADWIMRHHERMSDAQQRLVKDYVEIGHGN